MPELRWILIVAGLAILLAVYVWGRRLAPREEEKETILRSRAEPLISTPSYTPEIDDVTLELPVDQIIDDDEPRFTVEPLATEPLRVEPVLDDAPFVIDADDEPTFTPDDEPQPIAAAPSTEPTRIVQPVIVPEPVPAAAPAPRRARTATPRKILVLRLAAGPNRIPGDKLRQAFASQGLIHGKYEIFHYLHADGATLFSVASMVEPGSFDLAHMDATPYPGVTLFAQLPGSLPGQDVLEELLRNAKLLQSAVGGTLQDERGGLLNSARIQRLRQEVADFEQLCDAQTDEVVGAPVASS